MNTKLSSFLFTTCLLTVASVAAQSADRDTAAAKAMPVLSERRATDADDANRVPIAKVLDRQLELRATPGAYFAVLAAMARCSDDADAAPVAPSDVLWTGCIGEDGIARFPIPVLKVRTAPVDVSLHVVVSEDGTTFTLSPLMNLRLRPAVGDVTGVDEDGDGIVPAPVDGDSDGDAPYLKLDNQLPANHPARATLLSTDSLPPLYTVSVEVDAPSSGYALRFAGTRKTDSHLQVFFDVIFPDPTRGHLTVIETLSAFAYLGEASGAIEVVVRRADDKADKTKAARPIN